MTDLQVIYDQLTAIVWRNDMPDSAHGVHSPNRGYHHLCPICNGDLARVLEAAAPLFREQAAQAVEALPPFDPVEHETCLNRQTVASELRGSDG